ncbi:MAG: META domain-containing protein [Leptolyngbyaceae cyanobacterium SL_7_1]|nr:META domain-containing protein [Leptolyngbyaceae cyanobacterium SL_7_1]
MTFKIIFQQLMDGSVLLVVGAIAATAVNPAVAQSVSPPAQIAQTPTSLIGSWRLVNMTQPGSPMPMVSAQATEVTAEFAGDRIFGSGGCNRFMGSFQTEDAQLSISPLASTFIACEDAVMTQETLYLTALQAAQQYEIDANGNLAIFYETDQGSGVLRFAAQPTETTEPNQSSEPVQGLW